MIRSVVIAGLADVSALAAESGFFEASADERRARAKKRFGGKWAPEVVSWLADASGEDFVEAARAASGVAGGSSGSGPFLSGIADYVKSVTADALDSLDMNYSLLSNGERSKVVDGVLESSNSELTQAIRASLVSDTTHALVAKVREIAELSGQAGNMVVKVAAPVGSELRRDMRKALSKKYPDSYVAFHVDSELAGGLRIYADGNLIDASWMAEIDRIFSPALNS